MASTAITLRCAPTGHALRPIAHGSARSRRDRSTPPRGRRWRLVGVCEPRWFQSTPPRGRRQEQRDAAAHAARSFNPRLRAGGDMTAPWKRETRHVSIHASAREATRRRGLVSGRAADVSIHASAREATTIGVSMGARSDEFQSTPPRGRRPALGAIDARPPVSIHASAREATACSMLRVRRTSRFNPRLRAGGDLHLAPCASSSVSIHASAREATRDLAERAAG